MAIQNNKEATKAAPLLTVAINAYNEEDSIERCIKAVVVAVQNSNVPTEVLLYDDGSTDNTVKLAQPLLTQVNGRVVQQKNVGRAITCRRMVTGAAGQYVLVINTHLELGPDSIVNWERTRGTAPKERVACNGDIKFDTVTKYDVFWQTITEFGWRKYLLNRRPVSFTINNFDQFPKGTTMFVAPKQVWLDAYQETNIGENEELVSDDTRLLRHMAKKTPIWLDPEFSGTYFSPRTTVKLFSKNAVYRGTTFVDSYWESPSFVGGVIRAFPVALPIVLAMVVRYPKTSVSAAILLPSVLAAGGAVYCRRSNIDALKCAQVAPLFAATFSLGLLRGYKAKALKYVKTSNTLGTTMVNSDRTKILLVPVHLQYHLLKALF